MTLTSNGKVLVIYCLLYVIKFLKIGGTYFGLILRMYDETFSDNQSTDGYYYICVIIKNQHPL